MTLSQTSKTYASYGAPLLAAAALAALLAVVGLIFLVQQAAGQTNWLGSFDLSIFHAVNGYCGISKRVDRVAAFLAHYPLTGAIYAGAFWALWFEPAKDQARRHAALVTLFGGLILALVVNRTLSVVLPFRLRPMLTADIDYHAPLCNDCIASDWEKYSSFPSDHAVYFFVLATGLFVLSRGIGVALALVSGVLVLARVYLGMHWPSDIVGGAAIGIGFGVLFSRPLLPELLLPLLHQAKRFERLFIFLLFLALFEMAVMFTDVRAVVAGVLKMLRHAAG